ncbi:hypothetical protein [Pyrococcus kukulkanii]
MEVNILPLGTIIGGSLWAKVGLKIAGLSTEISTKRGERNAFICTLMKRWSEVLKNLDLVSLPWQIGS